MNKKLRKPCIIYKIEQSIKLQLLICCVLSSLVIISIIYANYVIDKKKSREYTIVDDIKLINSIESIETENNNMIINGYAFILDRNSTGNLITIFLRNIDNGEEVWLDINQVNRLDVETYFKCEYDYSNSGFVASTKLKNIKNDAIYEIFINIDLIENYDGITKKIRKTVSAQRYIQNNELYAYNPKEFDEPNINIESNLLKEVFSYGEICFYQKEAGMYLYQYKGKLFWIADDNFDFSKDGLTYIPYQLYTSQNDKLPTDRIQHKFDNLVFIFEQNEYTEETTTPYRVVIRDIPDDYAIAYIRTGVYDNVNKIWIWEKYFHLDGAINSTIN